MPDLRSPRVWLALVWSAFQLWTAYRGMFDLLIQLPVHVAFATALGFLSPPAGGRARWHDMAANFSQATLACVSLKRIPEAAKPQSAPAMTFSRPTIRA